jgi:hypothetical protein
MSSALVLGYRHLTVEHLENLAAWTATAYPQTIAYVDPQTGAAFMGPVQTSRGRLYLYDVRLHKQLFPNQEPLIWVQVLNDDADPWEPSTWHPLPLPPTPHRYRIDGQPICVHGGYEAANWTPIVSITAARLWLECADEWADGLYPEFADMSRHDIPKHIRDRVA